MDYQKWSNFGEEANVLSAYAPGGAACAQPREQGQEQKQQRPLPDDQLDGEIRGWVDMLNKHRKDPPAKESVAEFVARASAAQGEVFEGFGRFIAAAAKELTLTPEMAKDWKDKGNKAFKERKYEAAVVVYTRALMQTVDAQQTTILLNNRATSLFNIDLVQQALLDSDAAVATFPQYRKGFYRRGCCLRKLGHTELGDADVAASDASPEDEPLAAGVAERIAAVVQEVRAELHGSDVMGPPLHVGDCKWTQDADFGRRMLAGADLSPGAVVVSEPPFVTVLRTEHLLTHCEYCTRHTPNLYPARFLRPSCQLPGTRARGMYCSPVCAEKAWDAYGHAECRHPLFNLASPDLLLALRALLRTGVTASAAAGAPAGRDPAAWKPPADWESADHMLSLEGRTAENEWGLKAGGAETVCAALAMHSGALAVVLEPGLRPKDSAQPVADVSVAPQMVAAAAEQLRHLMRLIVTNAVSVVKTLRTAKSDSAATDVVRPTRVARSLFQVTPTVNHSCDPNAFLHFTAAPYFSGRGVVLRAIRPIAKGEEICISYADRRAPTTFINKNKIHSVPMLRQALSDQYGFHCRCKACTGGIPGDQKMSEEMQQNVLDASTYFKKGRMMMKQGRNADAIPALQSSLTILMTRVFVGEHSATFVVTKTHDALAECFALLGEWGRAREHTEHALRVVEMNNGEWDLETADHRIKLAGLCTRCSRFDEAEAALAKAEKTLGYYYGADGAAALQEVVGCRDGIAAAKEAAARR